MRLPHFPSRHSQSFKCLRRSNFVDEMQVNVQQRQPLIGLADEMGIPNLLE
jgi:hypothetical protein